MIWPLFRLCFFLTFSLSLINLVHPYPDVLHMPTSHISKEVPGGEPAFHRDDDYDKSIQQQQRFTSEYQQQAHLDHPKQPVQHTSGRPKWHSGKVGVLPQSASPSPQTQRRAAFEAVKQQRPQNNQDSSKVATRVPGKAVLRGGMLMFQYDVLYWCCCHCRKLRLYVTTFAVFLHFF